MSVKNQEYIRRYCEQVSAMRNALHHLLECVDAMPAPNALNELTSWDYGHIGSVAQLHEQLADCVRIADAVVGPLPI